MNRLRYILIAILLVLLFSLPAISVIYTEYLWFLDLGYPSAFLLRFYYQALLFLIGFIISASVVFLNLAPTIRDVEKVYAIPISRAERMLYYLRQTVKRYYRFFSIGIGLLISTLFAITISQYWELAVLFYNRVPSEIKVPVYGIDASFFLFTLPFLSKFVNWFLSLLIVSGVFVLVAYFFRSLTYTWEAFIQLFYWYRTHLFSLLSAISLVLAAKTYLQSFERAYSKFGVVFGPTYVDANYLISFYSICSLAFLLLSLIFLSAVFRWLKVKAAILAAGLILVFYTLGSSLVPGIIQAYVVSPNELRTEVPFIRNHIKLTRIAYDLDRFSIKELGIKNSLSRKEISLSHPALRSVRLWDTIPLLETFNQLQSIRTYYVFNDIDIDRYNLGGEKTQVAISVRELDTSKLADRAKTWINLHLKYTHGYGAVVSYVSTSTEEGLPVLILKDLPPKASFKELELKRPQIYFGEKTENYVIVGTREPEFGYPSGSKNIYEKWEGNKGVKLDSYLKKLAFSLRFGSLKILLSSDITDESRVLFDRHILRRVMKIAPYIAFDNDPYPVVAGGRIYWVIDGYTYSKWFPYSEPYGDGINYIRNSVKAVVDAYTGETDFYIFDSKDPIIRSYSKIFKDVFKDSSEMPDEIKAHIRYPVDLFTIQIDMMATYHMEDPQVFYNKEDRWAPAEEIYDRDKVRVEPYYVLLPFDPAELEGEPEFILMQPLTPFGKNNLNAWMFISSDGGNYGRGGVYQFPKGELVFGPMQIESRIDQDPEISKELTLWSQAGSQVIRGNLLVLPFSSGVLYIEPLYLKSERGSIPELKRVIVANQDKVVMSESLSKSLSLLLGRKVEEEKQEGAQTPQLTEIQELIQSMDTALKNGDLKAFGEYYQRLKQLIQETSGETKGKAD
jgi:hypothetical protein